ncbi:MAG: double-strand break repair protein AddB [Pseudomonadota bacterium]
MSASAFRGFYSVRPGADFSIEFARGFHDRFADEDPLAVARTLVLTNTARAARQLEEAIADLAPRAGPLPRIALIDQLPIDLDVAASLAPAIAPIRRQLRLTQLVEVYLRTRKASGEPTAPVSAAGDLARALALLIDQFHDEGISLEDLDAAISDRDLSQDAAVHWHRSLEFIDIVRKAWPSILLEKEEGAIDPRARQTAAVDAQIAEWQRSPPDTPVIAAATTGSVASTARLIQAIAELRRGAVVLPGFEPETDRDLWSNVTEDHPLGPFKRWMEPAGLTPANAHHWTSTDQTARQRLIAQALRPAPVTDHWHADAGALFETTETALDGISLVEAASPSEEAASIALIMRAQLEAPERRVALITPDAALSRRVTAYLDGFGIVPDDTSGQPLLQSAPAVFLFLLAELAARRSDALSLTALLLHPLMQPGLSRSAHLAFARDYTLKVLRRGGFRPGDVALPPPPRTETATDDAATWVSNINNAVMPVAEALQRGAPLSEILACHVDALEQLTTSDTSDATQSEPEIWTNDGVRLHVTIDQIKRNADAYGDQTVPDYPALLRTLLNGETIRPRLREPHPRVAIRGPREARLEDADLVILAGLNEGTWPALADPGPWLSRLMHSELGLPMPERTVGLSAHDFLQAVCRPEVILTRSCKIEGAPAVASRWLTRMQTLVEGVGAEPVWNRMSKRGGAWTELARRQFESPSIEPARRPRPTLQAIPEPREISVTDVETLIRDAYAIYAKRVLRLRPLDPLARAPDARDRGLVIHTIMEQVLQRTQPWPGAEAARTIFETVTREVLEEAMPRPDLRRIWRARMMRFTDWFIALEDERRAEGSPIAAECPGNMSIELPNGQFEIRAKADRIDRLSDGSAAIYDYKTGRPPSKDQIGTFSHQLHLQAAILAQGGFEDLPPMRTTDGAYIGVTGGKSGGIERKADDLAETAADYALRLQTLLADFDTGAPWISLGRPHRQSYASDYDHLARRAEWFGEDDA